MCGRVSPGSARASRGRGFGRVARASRGGTVWPRLVWRLDRACSPPAAETAERAGSTPVCCSLMLHTRVASEGSLAAPLRESCLPRMHSAPE
jgi:hypothetical protein